MKNRLKEWLAYHLPLYSWIRTGGFFVRPKMHVTIGRPWNQVPVGPVLHIPYLLDIHMHDTEYKMKYGEVRFERAPYVSVILFGIYEICVTWHVYEHSEDEYDHDVTDIYYEFLLTWRLGGCGSLLEALRSSGRWEGDSRIFDGRTYTEPQRFSLTRKGMRQLNKEIRYEK